ncbi:N-acetylglucosaminyl-diphospho-decaprenol L-rhamnosyltransferase [Burkholderia pseudomultivorans]|uniref:N-acetylglucosaminyl-diphospho-decaprenol L-rhamnosyltransferase n=2 Tax=Burkholderia pseudomultivorans TaxID=1207504 RepID=A0ABU2EF69_9BURK|nr:N-acetylglucosaminyl-diphospho-decaprenol L-rhamnosyltransferase [Burkholderia pseudomultivorans]MDR8739108.1 N-acetylglucosaminyl-diphospho-decaprenol L-rhamnosyltransferase [Burkholderia pseudomultivorans]MDR8745816.1 N-acetylglucosaminyl-diphospho-decaprenol L-rhamnosyltransferase [Burkholderia pseudomultivorans]MDR8758224.1 N-acetylglucosaminyl-diphospho-decaprenol L-rhamnosyltransferase [Burkholderia pseudomultivorans]MDR8782009.1 N-acetylglucosaminyl-diphospho-decaprenol L-rhamnosyltra
MLHRALQHIEDGFYIDVGAWSPDEHSVTRAFSDLGWRGINIEPNPFYFTQLESRRPRDINLQVAVGESSGSGRIHLFHDTGLSTLDDQIADHHLEAGWKESVQDVALTTLDNIWREHVGDGREVHFLKVDVEGLEREVLAGNNWATNRPWIVVVEATVPLTRTETHQTWEPILLDANYVHVYSDGLNRFYVADEHRELVDAFRYPPNVFDGFIAANAAELMAQVQALSARADGSEQREREARLDAGAVREKLEQSEGALALAREAAQAREAERNQLEHDNQALREQVEIAESRRAETEHAHKRLHREMGSQIAELRSELAERNTLVEQANHRANLLEQQYYSVTHSMLWRAVSPVRRIGASMSPSMRARGRQVLKAAWWLVTPWRMPARLEFLRQRRATGHEVKPVIESAPIEALQGLKIPEASSSGPYAEWIRNIESRTGQVVQVKPDKVLVSFLLVDVESVEALTHTVGSIRAQVQPNWEIVVARAGLDAAMLKTFEAWAAVDSRMVLTGVSGSNPGRATNLGTALDQAQGEYVAVLDGGDMLAPGALNEVAVVLDRASHADIVYGDEDTQSASGTRENPYFKPSWSPDLLYAFNYFGRLTLLRRSLIEKAGGLDAAAGTAVEWDINLRVSDVAQHIVRVPKVLCHRKQGGRQERPEPDTREAADCRAVIQRYWQRHGVGAEVKVVTQSNGTQHATWEIGQLPLVSIVVPTKNKPELLRMCVEGLLHGTDYSNKEIIIVDTGSDDAEILAYYRQLKSEPQVRLVHFRHPFNYSSACNFGASSARGEFLLFLNNDIEIVSRDWLQELVRVGMRPGIGVVGTKLVFPSKELQHAGVSIGIHLAALMYRDGKGDAWGVFGSPDHPRNWLAIMGACQLVRRSAFDEVGGFDESYRVAMSDVALCLQVRRGGYRTAYTPYACLVHHEGATRGKSNPVEDIRRLADDIRYLGIDEDPYLHPELDGRFAIPALRSQESFSVRETLVKQLDESGSFPVPTRVLRLDDDGVCLEIAGLPHDEVLWQPQAAHKVADRWSAARWCLDLLRRRSDLRARFPRALCDGSESEFARWLVDGAGSDLGLTEIGIESIKQLFAEDMGAPARQLFMFREDVRGGLPHGLTPIGCLDLFKWFIRHGRAEGDLRLEQIWWLFWQAAEDPARELVEAYRFTPAWQRLHPDGLTIFGRAAFASWFSATYRVHEHWVVPETWPVNMSPVEQIRAAYNAREAWRDRFPAALRDVRAARALIDWLQGDETALPRDVQAWCKSLDAESVATALAQLGVNVIGHFCYPSGLRVSVEALVKGLEQVGVATSLRDLRTDRRDDPHHVDFAGTEDFDVTIIHSQPEPFFDASYERSDLLERAERTYRIAYWYWEFDSVPESWVKYAEGADEVWTATEFVAKGLRDRLSIPVRTIFPGVQLGRYQRRDKSYFGLEDGEYTFLFTFHMMSIMERKNPLGLIRAFSKAFGPNDPVCLVLKTSFGDRHPQQLLELKQAAREAGVKIKIIDQVFSPDEVLSLMDACDVYVSLHRSEGLGLTMAEAMLMGKPVIATNYSGNVDFMDETNSLLVPYDLVKLGRPIPPYDANLHWAEPSVDEAAKQMRKVFENQAWARELGARARESAQKNLSVTVAGQRAEERIGEIRSSMSTSRSSV